MDSINKRLSLIAYYFSKYNDKALKELNYDNYTQAFTEISRLSGKNNNYLKLRRDEFDVLTNSHRKGWHKRDPAKDVLRLTYELQEFTFEQLTSIVKNVLSGFSEPISTEVEATTLPKINDNTIENLLNYEDEAAHLESKMRKVFDRVYNRKSIEQLKAHYSQRCQICGAESVTAYKVSTAEAHHIHSFSKTQDNSLNNVVILCPNHHRLFHKLEVYFNVDQKCFLSGDYSFPLKINYHL